MRNHSKNIVVRLFAVLLAVMMPVSLLAVKKVNAMTRYIVGMKSAAPCVTEGPLPLPYEFISRDTGYDFFTITNLHWEQRVDTQWYGFSYTEPVAINDGVTHIAISFVAELNDSSDSWANGAGVVLNGSAYNVGYTSVTKLDSYRLRVDIDFGTAVPNPPSSDLTPIQNVHLYENGNMTWDAFPGAAYYYLIAQKVGGATQSFYFADTSCNLNDLLTYFAGGYDVNLELYAMNYGHLSGGSRISGSWYGSWKTAGGASTKYIGDISGAMYISPNGSYADVNSFSLVRIGEFAAIDPSLIHCVWHEEINEYPKPMNFCVMGRGLSCDFRPAYNSCAVCCVWIEGYYDYLVFRYDNDPSMPTLTGSAIVTGINYPYNTVYATFMGMNVSDPEEMFVTWMISDDKVTWTPLSDHGLTHYVEPEEQGKYLCFSAACPMFTIGDIVSDPMYINTAQIETIYFYDDVFSTQTPPDVVYTGSKLSKPADPSVPGFIFVGWSLDEEGQIMYDFNSVVYGSFALYANWSVDVDYDCPINLIVNPNGYAAVSKTTAKFGDIVSVAATPSLGYEIDKIIWKTAKGEELNITGSGSFIVEGGAVTITVSFKPRSASSDPTFAEFIERLYNVALNRMSEPDGKAFWLNKVLNEGFTGADCARGFLIQSPEFGNRGLNNDQFLVTLYKTFFDREPDTDGYAFWSQKLAEGMTREQVIEGFIDATEWCNLCAKYGVKSGATNFKATTPSKNATNFALRLYVCCMGRTPDEGGLDFWALRLTNLESSGYEAARDFFLSQEFKNMNTTNEEFVTRLYRTFMGREPDTSGFSFWIGHLTTDMTREEVIKGFAQSQEFKNICNEYGIDRGI